MRLLPLALAATLALAPLAPRPAAAQSSSASAAPIPQAAQSILPPTCPAAKASTRLSAPLARTAARLRAGQPITIVAIGSSSTAGAGATSASASYPSRLQAALRERFPGADITVLNRGVNGQDAPEMLARFDADVAAAKPTLVIWQAGVNALFRADGLATAGPELRQAITRIRALDADLVLVDPQYSPRVIADADTGAMIRLIDAVASEEGVDVYHRYALMRDWHEAGRMPFESFLAKDSFHMNDWGYDCFARDLGRSMAANIDAQQRAADLTPSASRSSAKPSAFPAKNPSAPVSATP
ncbi:SGNH/GDSL hydrolase family protein [Ancylobacter amanitiformis]|uniref:Lysophospholipase L1-like esterase n=1 Tax=Ancylobacter amanitiformis TaxID=217069 RepID=A0ABU0LLI8_9HYPH|nr:SGNH/GDSL hydrolase family protein [Ancylobacter amanitiformis]MDQ0509519.1 lysophospholipase L1-like esterase [Ancylobacter amanitiformis]